jgi:hypothetical protein
LEFSSICLTFDLSGPLTPALTSSNPNTLSSSPAMDNSQPSLPIQALTPPKHHSPHPGCPDSLGCLADSESKPRDTFATIIRCAILSTPTKRMTLNCIYTAIEEKYPYYRDAGPGWKVSFTSLTHFVTNNNTTILFRILSVTSFPHLNNLRNRDDP